MATYVVRSEVKERLRVVTFVSCHVYSEDRLNYLRFCLESIRLQASDSRFPDLRNGTTFISWTAQNPKFEALVRLLSRDHKYAVWIEPPFPRRRLSQFEHYKRTFDLVSLFFPIDSTWVMFSDDDDVWARDRRLQYQGAIVTASSFAIFDDVSSVFASNFVRIDDDMASSVRAETAEDVTKLLTEHPQALSTLDFLASKCEHWQYCVRLGVIRDFFQRVPPKCLSGIFCDLTFITYVKGYDKGRGRTVQISIPDPSRHWMYYWRNSVFYSGASTRVATNPEDSRDLAIYQRVWIDLKKEKCLIYEDGDDLPDTVLKMMHDFRNVSLFFAATHFLQLTESECLVKYPDKFVTKSNLENALYFFIVIRCNSLVHSLEDMGYEINDVITSRYSAEADRLYKFYYNLCRNCPVSERRLLWNKFHYSRSSSDKMIM